MLKKIFKKEAAKPPVLSSRSTVLSNGLELDCLPEELLRQVFSYLSPEDLCAFCRVNELWRSIVEEDAMWRRHIPEKPVGVYKKDTPLKRIYKDELGRSGPRPAFKPYVAKGIEHHLTVQELFDVLIATKKGLNWRQYSFRVRHYGMNRMTYLKDVFGDDNPDETIVCRRADTLVRMYCRDLVPGDILELRPGDHVPADVRLIRGDGLLVDRSFLTGDSHPQYAHPAAQPHGECLIEDSRNCVLLGSQVLAGTCTGVVIGIGNQTYLGRLSFAILQERVQAFRARSASTGGPRARGQSPALPRTASPTDPSPKAPAVRSAAPEKMRPATPEMPRKAVSSLALKVSNDGKPPARKSTRTDEQPDVRNKKMFPLLNKVSTLVIDSETLFTTDAYAVSQLHCDAVTVGVGADAIERINNAPSGKTLVLLTEGLALILALTAPHATEDPSKANVNDLLDSHTNDHLRALGAFARAHGNPDAALALATWRCAHQVWSEQEHFTSLLYLRKKKPEVLILGTPERILSTCNKQLVDGKEAAFDWKERMKTVHELREKQLVVYALISNSRLEEGEGHLTPNVVMERRRMTFVGFICLSRQVNPQAQLLLSKVRESETKLVVLFPCGVDSLKNWAVQCGAPILFDCMRHSKEKPMEIENPLEVDPNNRSILVNYLNISKDQLRPIFSYDRIYMPRMGAAAKEQLVHYLKDMGETVAVYALGMNDVIGALAADIVLCQANAPLLISAQSNVVLATRDSSQLVSLFEAIKVNNGNKCSIQ